jgi:hypothetical protein
LLFCFVPCQYYQELKQAECDGAQAFGKHEKTGGSSPGWSL